ncbi:hypothetical protein Fot_21709 [Forsythia ovata]|uniref:Uncharacterized protein n=1 Tax=Forsythia ovata TaxID=205694 RepID=A0ABD1UVL7_9LAMI
MPRKKRNRHHKKMSIAQTVSNLAKQVQMLVQENRASGTMSSGRIVDEEKGGVQARAPAASHTHPYNDPRDSRHYQPVNPLKERGRRPARFTSVFDQLGDMADSDKKKVQYYDGRMIESLLRDPIYEPGYS